MERFLHIESLWWLLALLPLAALFGLYMWKRAEAWRRLGEAELLERLAPERDARLPYWKWIMLSVSVIACIFALAQPQGGAKTEMLKRESSDVFVAFDISSSMLAEDLQPNRLERARLFATRLIDQLKGDRIGLIFFAGEADLYSPLTTDYNAAKVLLKTANPVLASRQGTAISEAVKLATDAFNRDPKDQKALIIISDGEDHEEAADLAVEEAHEMGVTIFTVGLGTVGGAPVPVTVNGQKRYKRDRAGAPVMSRLNEDMMRQLAKKGGGSYVQYNGGDAAINQIINGLSVLEKKAYESVRITEYEDYFQWFLGFGFALLAIESFWFRRRRTGTEL
ncbi:MAG: VWA domain-containing protein [Planctomycetota bacterium]